MLTPQPPASTGRSIAMALGAILLSACSLETVEDPFASDPESVDEGSGALSNGTYWCPSGSYDPTYRLCTTATEALGPFTPAMIKTCKAQGGGESACEKPWWSAHFAKSIRGTGRCLPGSTLDAKKGYCTDSENVYGPFSFALVDRCRRSQGGPACETTRWAKGMVPDRPNVWCPDGTDYDFEHRLCISEKEAVGPFTSSMIDTCIKAGGGSKACSSDRWDLPFARWARGTGPCPKGASFDSKKGYCAEGDDLFGPFSPTLVSQCRTKGGGQACDGMRWKKSMVPDTATATNPSSVPYYYQYNNAYEPGGTCGLTSGAMLLRRWGKNVTPDSLYLSYGKAQGQSPGNLANLYRAHGLSATSSYTASESTIKSHLDAGRPVVVHGYFTGAGHIVLLVGYDATGWFVNDPAGKWAGCVGCGYPNRTSTNGRDVHYSYASVRAAIGSSGNIWMSTAY
jgi:hypothetical protein